jgi:hypothetical protein
VSLLLFSSVFDFQTPRADEVNVRIGGQLVGEVQSGRPTVSISEDLWDGLRAALPEHAARFDGLPPQQKIDLVFTSMRRVLPSALIVFLPFLAVGLKLIFVRRGILYVDHLVFALHFQCLLFGALSLTWPLARLASLGAFGRLLLVMAAFVLSFAIYLPLSLSRAYRTRRLGTVVRSVAVFLLYGILVRMVIGTILLLVVLLRS